MTDKLKFKDLFAQTQPPWNEKVQKMANQIEKHLLFMR